MTVKLSPHKVSKILRDYFRGLPQIKIGEDAGVDQSSISHYATGFKKKAANIGVQEAGKEYMVFDEVESLRSLSVELYQSKLTVNEAKQGHNIIKAFLKLGISPEKHLLLIKVCQDVGAPGFIDGALKLIHIKSQTGMDYDQIMTSFEKALSQIPQLEEKVKEAQSELNFINGTLIEKKQELASQNESLAKYQKEAKAKVDHLEIELASKIKQMDLKNKDIEQIAQLKSDLVKQGLDIPTLIKIAKEFTDGNGKY